MSGLKVDILGYSGPGSKNGFEIRNQHRRIDSLSFWVPIWVKNRDLQTSKLFYCLDTYGSLSTNNLFYNKTNKLKQ